MKKNRITYQPIFLLVLTLILLHSSIIFPQASEYGSAREVVKESITEIQDNTMKNKGWVAVQANPPQGFEGIICLDLETTWGLRKETIEISAIEHYLGGDWLPVGTYQVIKVYVPDGNEHFFAEVDAEEIEVSAEQDALVTITLTLNEETDAHRESVSSQQTQPTVVTEPETIPATTEPAIVEPEDPPLFSPLQIFLLCLLFAAWLLSLIVVFVLSWKQLFH